MFEAIDPAKFGTLVEISALINSNYGNATSLLTQILESATRLTEGEASSLILHDRNTGKLRFEIALGPKGRDVKKFLLNPGEGIAGWVVLHGRSLIVNDTDMDSRFYADISKSIGYPTYSILAVPMRVREETVGLIEILNKRHKKYFTQDLLFKQRLQLRMLATSKKPRTRFTIYAIKFRQNRVGTILSPSHH
jgi:signal transduction protein with GAF and PtsI domain